MESKRYHFLFETAIGLAILIGINLLLSAPPAFHAISPHPYWVVILLMACRYGTLAGVTAGALSAASYIIWCSLAGEVDFVRFRFPYGPYIMPFLFVLTGGLLGEIRSYYKKKYRKLDRKHEETVAELRDLGLQFSAVNESKTELEKRIAFQSTTLLQLVQQISSLETVDVEEVYQKIPDLLREQLNIQRTSVYLLQESRFRLKHRDGEGNSDLPDILDVQDGLPGQVFHSGRTVTINDLQSEDDFDKFSRQEVIMASPLLRRDDSIFGIIVVEKMPFFDYHANSVRIFEMLTVWLGNVIERAMQFRKLQDRNIADEITGAYNFPSFQKRLKYEIARSKRFNTPLSLLLLEIERFEELTQPEQNNVLIVLNWIFNHLLREIDIIAKFRHESAFAIILPGQINRDAEKVAARITRELENYKLHPFEESEELLKFKTGLSTLHIATGSYGSLVKAAEQRLMGGGERKAKDLHSDINYLLNQTSSPQPEQEKS